MNRWTGRAGSRWIGLVIAVVTALAGTVWTGASAGAGPVRAGGPASVNVTSISAGFGFSCGVRGDGTVACWGANGDGQSTPPAGTFTAVSAGYWHACGLRTDASITCWGADEDGAVSGAPGGSFTAVSTGSRFSCGLLTSGDVTCWGDQSLGRAPALVPGPFITLSSGGDHSCGLRPGGGSTCWGDDSEGQSTMPEPNDYVGISAGGSTTCGIHRDGSVSCVGEYPNYGYTPPAGANLSSLEVGIGSVCGITSTDASLLCWGAVSPADTPPTGAFRAVSVGWVHECAVRTDGTAVCWGDPSSGELGTPPAAPAPAPATATAGAAYSHTFTSGTGSPSGGFVVASGTLPPGLTLAANGVLSGTPTAVGTTSFTVAATDGIFPAAATTFTLTVAPPPDTTAPTTTIALAPGTPSGSNGWYRGPVTVSVSATDAGSGVGSTRCVLDPASAPTTVAALPAGPCAYTTATAVTVPGAHTLYAASVDRAGNAEAVTSATFRIDGAGPTLAPTLPARVLLRQAGVTATPNATDAVSGVATQSCGAVDTSTAGARTVTCQATDKAGNTTSVQVPYTVEYQVLAFSSPAAGATVKAGSTVSVRVALADGNGALVPDAEAQALATAGRVTVAASGPQTLAAQAATYSASTDRFQVDWRTAKSPAGTETITVAVTYPSSAVTTTRGQVLKLS